jgi:hypothetical protein
MVLLVIFMNYIQRRIGLTFGILVRFGSLSNIVLEYLLEDEEFSGSQWGYSTLESVVKIVHALLVCLDCITSVHLKKSNDNELRR